MSRTMVKTAEEIQGRVNQLAREIDHDYRDKPLLLVGVLKGSFIFLADLVRAISIPCAVEFIGVASYEGSQSTGKVRLTHDLSRDVEGMHILLVEDIVDTGLTMAYLLDLLRLRGPVTVKVCSLLQKPDSMKVELPVDYLGFEISPEFVVGYGLDLDELYRGLPYLVRIDEPKA